MILLWQPDNSKNLKNRGSSLRRSRTNPSRTHCRENHRLRVIRPEHLAAIALSVGRPKDRARLVYLTELLTFDFTVFHEILARYQLSERWREWASALGLQT